MHCELDKIYKKYVLNEMEVVKNSLCKTCKSKTRTKSIKFRNHQSVFFLR